MVLQDSRRYHRLDVWFRQMFRMDIIECYIGTQLKERGHRLWNFTMAPVCAIHLNIVFTWDFCIDEKPNTCLSKRQLRAKPQKRKKQQATHLTRHTSVLKTFPASSKAINIFRPLHSNEVLELSFNQLLLFLNPNKDDSQKQYFVWCKTKMNALLHIKTLIGSIEIN